jgi:hypothetical protein
MSSYHLLSEVSKTLKALIWDALRTDPTFATIIGSEAAITFTNPTETARDSDNRLSLWLYRISENEFVKNGSMSATAASNTERLPPLALNLFYLLTPFGATGDADHLLLGKAMQTLYDNAQIPLRNRGDDVFEDLRLVLCRVTLEELTRIWEALREPYRLSVCYQVCVGHVDSGRQRIVERVTARDQSYGEKPIGRTE